MINLDTYYLISIRRSKIGSSLQTKMSVGDGMKLDGGMNRQGIATRSRSGDLPYWTGKGILPLDKAFDARIGEQIGQAV